MITIIAEFQVKSGKREEFIRLASECTRNTKKEAGNLSYKVFSGRKDENKFTFIEEWANDVAIEKHNAMPHFNAFIEGIKPLIEGDVKINEIMRVSQIR